MRRVEPTRAVLPQKKQFSAGKRTGRPISEVADGCHGSNCAAQRDWLRRGDKSFVDR